MLRMCSESPMLSLLSKLSPPRPERTPAQKVMDDLDYQHDQVRDAYAVMRGELRADD